VAVAFFTIAGYAPTSVQSCGICQVRSRSQGASLTAKGGRELHWLGARGIPTAQREDATFYACLTGLSTSSILDIPARFYLAIGLQHNGRAASGIGLPRPSAELEFSL